MGLATVASSDPQRVSHQVAHFTALVGRWQAGTRRRADVRACDCSHSLRSLVQVRIHGRALRPSGMNSRTLVAVLAICMAGAWLYMLGNRQHIDTIPLRSAGRGSAELCNDIFGMVPFECYMCSWNAFCSMDQQCCLSQKPDNTGLIGYCVPSSDVCCSGSSDWQGSCAAGDQCLARPGVFLDWPMPGFEMRTCCSECMPSVHWHVP